ncbi:2-phospho-L-lactate transferase CofD family protein [Georgenia sp. SUBG003]|uniref:2-phospho-L-lactate transferase CofD family protein n=1 Tax=Georgenia sp. SUBG003 TaxID=1497974 RepID=UPI000ABBFCE3
MTLLAGGVGGAKLAQGLARASDDVTVVVNTGDDAEIYGLSVSPDLDTVMYTLAGIADPQNGWGVAGDTFTTLEQMTRLGQDTWFRLGDRDIATHVLRTAQLRAGVPLSATTAQLAAALGVRARLLPMTDDPRGHPRRHAGRAAGVPGVLRGPAPPGRGARRRPRGRRAARPAPGVLDALDADVVVVGPSNPFVSIGPVLAVPGVRERLAASAPAASR